MHPHCNSICLITRSSFSSYRNTYCKFLVKKSTRYLMVHTNSRELITHSNRTRESYTTYLTREFALYRSIFYRKSFTCLKSFIRNTINITCHKFNLIYSIRAFHTSITKNTHRINLIQITYDNFTIIKPIFCKYKVERSSACTSHTSIIGYFNTIFISSLNQRNISLGTTYYIPRIFIISIKFLSRKL